MENIFDRINRLNGGLKTVVAVVAFIGSLVLWYGTVRTHLHDEGVHIKESKKTQLLDHMVNTNVHMSLKDKESHFVTRREYEATIERIAEDLKFIKERTK